MIKLVSIIGFSISFLLVFTGIIISNVGLTPKLLLIGLLFSAGVCMIQMTDLMRD